MHSVLSTIYLEIRHLPGKKNISYDTLKYSKLWIQKLAQR